MRLDGQGLQAIVGVFLQAGLACFLARAEVVLEALLAQTIRRIAREVSAEGLAGDEAMDAA